MYLIWYQYPNTALICVGIHYSRLSLCIYKLDKGVRERREGLGGGGDQRLNRSLWWRLRSAGWLA